MATGTVLWAGKQLSADEEVEVRRVVSFFRRTGELELADNFERFLPENEHRWSPDELELGAHVGPWVSFEARPELDEAA
jgi:hypothetical protein